MRSASIEELLGALDSAIGTLRGKGETHWSTWLQADRDRIALGDFHGVEHLLGAFGGMGSFTDFASGGELEQPSARIYKIASELRRDMERT